MIGLARSGKSTIAEAWVNYEIDFNGHGSYISCQHHNKIPRVIVCADDIRIALSNDRYNSLCEPMVHAIKSTMIRALLLKHDVLVDGTHTTEGSIIELLNIDPGATHCLVYTPPLICKERATRTKQEDLHPVIDRMATQLNKLIGEPCSDPYTQLEDKINIWRQSRITQLRREKANESA